MPQRDEEIVKITNILNKLFPDGLSIEIKTDFIKVIIRGYELQQIKDLFKKIGLKSLRPTTTIHAGQQVHTVNLNDKLCALIAKVVEEQLLDDSPTTVPLAPPSAPLESTTLTQSESGADSEALASVVSDSIYVSAEPEGEVAAQSEAPAPVAAPQEASAVSDFDEFVVRKRPTTPSAIRNLATALVDAATASAALPIEQASESKGEAPVDEPKRDSEYIIEPVAPPLPARDAADLSSPQLDQDASISPLPDQVAGEVSGVPLPGQVAATHSEPELNQRAVDPDPIKLFYSLAVFFFTPGAIITALGLGLTLTGVGASIGLPLLISGGVLIAAGLSCAITQPIVDCRVERSKSKLENPATSEAMTQSVPSREAVSMPIAAASEDTKLEDESETAAPVGESPAPVPESPIEPIVESRDATQNAPTAKPVSSVNPLMRLMRQFGLFSKQHNPKETLAQSRSPERSADSQVKGAPPLPWESPTQSSSTIVCSSR